MKHPLELSHDVLRVLVHDEIAAVRAENIARLNAAAPQLAEALRDLLFLCWEDDQPEVIRARAALTAAGVTP